jgi:phospholipase/carboxylesterase
MLQTDLVKANEPGSNDLLIALHGLGDSMEGYRWLSRALGMSRLNVLLVNAPDAYYGGFSWFDFAGDFSPGIERSYRALEELLKESEQNGFPNDRTILFGFSQGCLMTVETGLRYERQLAGCIGVSGWVHEPKRLLKLSSAVAKQERFLITHGLEDPLIRVDQARTGYEHLKAAGIQIEYREFRKEHTILEEEIGCFGQFIRDRLGYDL